MTLWFTSDTHFGHANIIKYCNRPFSYTKEMDETLIKNWNACVQPNDQIYHLGDFSFHGEKYTLDLLSRLNGKKHLITGNHDKRLLKSQAFLDKFVWVKEIHELAVQDRDVRFITLCHFPFLTWNKSHWGTWSLHGHTHGGLPDDPNVKRLDVGVDCFEYRPVSYYELKSRMDKKIFKPRLTETYEGLIQG